MSSPTQPDEDEIEEEVEFVSEGPLRPVLEYIDLSDSDNEGCSSFGATQEDNVTRQKAHVASTLDRLEQQVDQERRERADKCREFKEKQILQKAHGERAVRSSNGLDLEAKHCVDMWLKMPGVQPGVISGRSGGRRQRSTFVSINSSTRHTCPVVSCGRVYDSVMLLDGHLKRFDHSPCDPTIHLKGLPAEIFACVACGQHFQTKDLWKKHLEAKVASNGTDCHDLTQTYQRIVCFACPACFLLFNLRDACLQHMSAKNHFTDSFMMNETRETAVPVPVPQLAKNHLIMLCKDTPFNVRCSLCHKILASHQAAQAHFNVHCRQGCAVAKADKTIVEVMKQLQVRGQCSVCCQTFVSLTEIEKHRESTQHVVEVNQTMAQALLQFSRFNEIQHIGRTTEMKRESTGMKTSFQNRSKKRNERECSPAKRQRLNPNMEVGGGRKVFMAWYCECGQQFSEEAAASKHLLAVNQIFHQCAVCGKHMGESSITRLHMSRFHGGAHLSNFLYYCRTCKLEMPRYEDILSHVLVAHSGHTYFTEQEVPEEFATLVKAKPSKSVEDVPPPSPQRQEAAGMSSGVERSWMCRMCEDVFGSEEAIRQHCRNMSNHSFQRFICGHCPQRFYKESTVRRHCMSEHNGQVKSSHFCGLCDSMRFESEQEFLEHYQSLHSKDYYCMEDEVQPTAAHSTSQDTCLCMGSKDGTEGKRITYTQCMRSLAAEGKCQYVCSPCSVIVSSYAQIKTHVHTKHTALNLDKTFEIECKMCQESFTGVPSFHKHFHSQHCSLEPCVSARTSRNNLEPVPSAVKILNAVEIQLDEDEIDDETLAKFVDETKNKVEDCDSDAELKQALMLSAEEARKESSGE
ncbi:E3 SUMO-protein ligase ZNF451 isoform X2 [Gouania willdenowi]|uniref:E3 SUMO-protein ligase ZNF451 isoform X2 n=1 Tax=Gouania willdenowi TaxID=441366 RepID=UPI0010541181|nr:E3 SUMO-protein ligase ZNF451 isoform X2 [Gouania willdenowi]